MQTIGLVGGMSWHSTAQYYRWINETVATKRGGHASAQVVLHSLDFDAVRHCQLTGDWDAAAALLTTAALRCQDGGADVVAICTNLMHKVAPQVERALDVPLLHIADAVAVTATDRGWTRLGLLATRWVMEEPFYRERLGRHDIDVVVPDADGRAEVDGIIFDELTVGTFTARSRRAYVDHIERLAEQGAEAVVLACTEIGLLVADTDSPLPLLDSARAHADALCAIALREPATA